MRASCCRSVVWDPSAFETRVYPTSMALSVRHIYDRLRDSAGAASSLGVTVNFVWRVFAASCGGLPSLNLLLPKCTT